MSTTPELEWFDLDSVAAIIVSNNQRYLLQHRENRPDISHPNKWCLFGGAREPGEPAAEALKREMIEELNFHVHELDPFLTCIFETWYEGRRTRKFFFSIQATDQEAERMALREGQGLAWLSFAEILVRGNQL